MTNKLTYYLWLSNTAEWAAFGCQSTGVRGIFSKSLDHPASYHGFTCFKQGVTFDLRTCFLSVHLKGVLVFGVSKNEKHVHSVFILVICYWNLCVHM